MHQSRRPYDPVFIDELLLTPPARTAVDLSLQLRTLDAVQQLLGRAAQRASESRLLRLLQQAGFPMPELNAAVATAIGTRYVDALWRLLGKAVEVDGQAWHLSPAS